MKTGFCVKGAGLLCAGLAIAIFSTGIGYSLANSTLDSQNISSVETTAERNSDRRHALLQQKRPSAKEPVSSPLEKLSVVEVASLQILLDREGISPGVINGKTSDYLVYAFGVFNSLRKDKPSLYEESSLKAFIRGEGKQKDKKSRKPVFVEYEITKEDVAGPFVSHIPARIQDQAKLPQLSYRSPLEALAERFHMDEGFLQALNPGADFNTAGTKIRVANTGKALEKRVAFIRAEMDGRRVTAFDARGEIVAAYPASIGSPQTPSPRGRFAVRNKAGFPKYTLSPGNNFEPVDSGRQVVVAAGPNNPVGTAWIGLSKPSYGIHGTPEPSKVGEAGSNGCIRLTNWDAMELARLVRAGVQVVIE